MRLYVGNLACSTFPSGGLHVCQYQSVTQRDLLWKVETHNKSKNSTLSLQSTSITFVPTAVETLGRCHLVTGSTKFGDRVG